MSFWTSKYLNTIQARTFFERRILVSNCFSLRLASTSRAPKNTGQCIWFFVAARDRYFNASIEHSCANEGLALALPAHFAIITHAPQPACDAALIATRYPVARSIGEGGSLFRRVHRILWRTIVFGGAPGSRHVRRHAIHNLAYLLTGFPCVPVYNCNMRIYMWMASCILRSAPSVITPS